MAEGVFKFLCVHVRAALLKNQLIITIRRILIRYSLADTPTAEYHIYPNLGTILISGKAADSLFFYIKNALQLLI